MRVRSLLFAALLLTGCATAGTKFRMEDVRQLSAGMPKAEVVRILGEPNYVVTDATGGQRLTWTYASGSIVGVKSRAVALSFDDAGKLVSVPQIPAE